MDEVKLVSLMLLICVDVLKEGIFTDQFHSQNVNVMVCLKRTLSFNFFLSGIIGLSSSKFLFVCVAQFNLFSVLFVFIVPAVSQVIRLLVPHVEVVGSK